MRSGDENKGGGRKGQDMNKEENVEPVCLKAACRIFDIHFENACMVGLVLNRTTHVLPAPQLSSSPPPPSPHPPPPKPPLYFQSYSSSSSRPRPARFSAWLRRLPKTWKPKNSQILPKTCQPEPKPRNSRLILNCAKARHSK